jgi:glycosyltransferase involved in cell wall biosynthesis
MREPLRRIFVTTDAVGGVWRYSMELCSAWSERGVSVTLAVVGPSPSGAQRQEAWAIQGLDLMEANLPLDWLAQTPETLEDASASLAELADLCRANSVHLHAPALVGDGAWPGPVVAVIHSCLLTWWKAMRAGPPPAAFAANMEAAAQGLRRAGAIIAPSQAFATTVRQAYGLDRSIASVNNGRRPMHLPDRPRARSVFAAGRLWDEAKNISALDDAAAGLDVPVTAAGEVSAPGASPLQLRHIRHAGVLDETELASHYASHTVYAGLSLYEPFGLSVLEAAQSGMALVLSDIPVFRELWNDAAIFVDGRDVGAIREGLSKALLEAEPLAHKASMRAVTFTRESMASRTLSVHDGLLRASIL